MKKLFDIKISFCNQAMLKRKSKYICFPSRSQFSRDKKDVPETQISAEKRPKDTSGHTL